MTDLETRVASLEATVKYLEIAISTYSDDGALWNIIGVLICKVYGLEWPEAPSPFDAVLLLLEEIRAHGRKF